MKKLLISVLIIAALLASACISDKDATTEEPTENISQIDAAPLIPRNCGTHPNVPLASAPHSMLQKTRKHGA